jgi:serine/threonine protein kinase/Tol biopolymer transport system component
MTNQQQSAEELFEAVLDLPPDARPEFLDKACRDAPKLRRSVERLLAEEQKLGGFLDQPIFSFAKAVSNGSANGSSHGSSNDRATTLALAPAPPPQFRPDDIIASRFQVVRYIARGGMGEVYEVQDQFLQGDNVALKIIRPEIAGGAGSSRRFEREVISSRKAHHPNLCPIYDIFRCDQSEPPFLFLTMKLLHGETLGALLKRVHTIPLGDAVEICNQLISGVAAMHEAGIIHRDLKPGNIMVEQTGQFPRVSIMDFGLARSHDSEVTVVPHGVISGTPGYMAPELLRGATPSKASDLFALGVVMHLVLCGERPVTAKDGMPEIPSAALRRAGAPGYLVEASEGILSASPEERCRAFEGLWPTKETRKPKPPAPGVASGQPHSGQLRPIVYAGVAAAVAAAIAFAAWFARTPLPGPLDSNQITSSTESKEAPLFTDGARLYFDSHGQLSQMSIGGGVIAPLPNPVPAMRTMDISADGSQILALDPTVDAHIVLGKLWVISTLAGTRRKLSEQQAMLGRWSPDASFVIFTDHQALFRIDADGSNLRKIWTAPATGFISDLAVSPDARTLSVTVAMPWKPDLWTLSIEGKDAHPLQLDWPASDERFSGQWTPDGKHFVFLSTREGHLNLYELIRPRWFQFWKKQTAVRLSGNQIDIQAFAPARDNKGVFALGTLQQGAMRVFNARTGAFEPFLGGISSIGFVISPDHQWMAYTDYPTGNLWKSRLDGTEKQQLTTSTAAMQSWSPDSKDLVYSNFTELYMVSADGGAPHKLVPATDPKNSIPAGVDDADMPSWAPDGRSIYFSYFPYPDLPRRGIFTYDLASRKTSLIPGSQGLFSPTWSPDGRYLVAADMNPNRIMLYAGESKPWHELQQLDTRWLSWVWANDSKSLYVVMADPDRAIYRLTVPQGTWTKVTSIDSLNLSKDFDLERVVSLTGDGRIAMMEHTDVTQVYSLAWKH